jgi:hypothetical protein
VKIPILIFVLFVTSFSFAGQIVLEGKYHGEDMYVQNPYSSDTTTFCTDSIIVNGIRYEGDIRESAYKLDLESFGFELGTDLVISIYHKDDCKPKVLNEQPHPTKAELLYEFKLHKLEYKVDSCGDAGLSSTLYITQSGKLIDIDDNGIFKFSFQSLIIDRTSFSDYNVSLAGIQFIQEHKTETIEKLRELLVGKEIKVNSAQSKALTDTEFEALMYLGEFSINYSLLISRLATFRHEAYSLDFWTECKFKEADVFYKKRDHVGAYEIETGNSTASKKIGLHGSITVQPNNEPLPFAVIKLSNKKDTIECISDFDGIFYSADIKEGEYNLTTHYPGWQSLDTSIIIMSKNEQLNLRLKEDTVYKFDIKSNKVKPNKIMFEVQVLKKYDLELMTADSLIGLIKNKPNKVFIIDDIPSNFCQSSFLNRLDFYTNDKSRSANISNGFETFKTRYVKSNLNDEVGKLKSRILFECNED